MISDSRIFNLMEQVVRDSSLEHRYDDTLQPIVDATGQPYMAYLLKNKKKMKAGSKIPPVRLGRMLVLADGQRWLGLLNSWVRDDERGKKIQEAYELVYEAIDHRWTEGKEKKEE